MSPSLPPNIKLLSLAFLASTLLYIVVVFVLASSGGWSFSWTVVNPLILIVLAGVAFSLAGVVLLLGKLPLLPRLALAETIGILGLVAAFLNQSPLWVLPFVGLSILLQVFLSPFLARENSPDLTSGNG